MTRRLRAPYPLDRMDARVRDWIAANKGRLETPLYLYDEQELRRSVQEFRGIMPAGSRLFYSLKANPQPGLVHVLDGLDVGAEIASAGEKRATEIAGVRPGNVLAGGVIKSTSYLADLCLSEPAAIVLDSSAEWVRLQAAAARTARGPSVLIRVNPGISLGGLDMAGKSQFGFGVEQALRTAREVADHPSIEFAGLHVYFGSQRLTIAPVAQMLTIVGDVVARFRSAGLPPATVDLGLGCGVPYLEKDEPLAMAAVRRTVEEKTSEPDWRDIELWFEAGRALVATCGYFVARVSEVKSLNGKTFVFVDGGINVHNPGIALGRVFRSNPRFFFVTDRHAPTQEQRVDIVGSLCTSADALGTNVAAPPLEEGDLVIVPNSGAYCQATGFWGFNTQRLCTEAMLDTSGELRPFESQHRLIF